MSWFLVVGYCTIFYCDVFTDGPFKSEEDCKKAIHEYELKNEKAPPNTISYNSLECVFRTTKEK